MIQRIQSVWFFLASLINGLLFLPSIKLYKDVTPGGAGIPGMASAVGREEYLGATTSLPLMIIAAVITLLPLVAIFLFKNRKQQRGLAGLAIVGVLAFVAVMVMIVASYAKHPGDSYLVPGPVLPVVGLVFIFLGIRNIRKDEKLLKSLDRLR